MLETSYVKLNNSIFKQNMQKMYKSEVKERMSNEVSLPPSLTVRFENERIDTKEGTQS